MMKIRYVYELRPNQGRTFSQGDFDPVGRCSILSFRISQPSEWSCWGFDDSMLGSVSYREWPEEFLLKLPRSRYSNRNALGCERSQISLAGGFFSNRWLLVWIGGTCFEFVVVLSSSWWKCEFSDVVAKNSRLCWTPLGYRSKYQCRWGVPHGTEMGYIPPL